MSDDYIIFNKAELERAFAEYDPNGAMRSWLEQIQTIVGFIQEKEKKDVEAELNYLRHFFCEADFGPADGDVRDIIRDDYDGVIPEGYGDEE